MLDCEATESLLSTMVDSYREDPETAVKKAESSVQVEFLQFLKRRSDYLSNQIASTKFAWHSYPVVSVTNPPIGSDIERNYLVRSFLYGKNSFLYQGSITVALSYQCSCHCRQCYISEFVNHKRQELSLDQFAILFSKIINDLYIWHIDITGGEPLEHPQFFEIMDLIPKDRATALVATNGINLNQETVNRIKNSNIMACKVSLDSYSKTAHDKNRAFPGAYEKVLQGIELLIKNNVCTFVQTFIEKGCGKDDELEKLIVRCRELGVRYVHFITPLIIGNLKDRNDLFLEAEDRRYLYHLQKKYRSANFQIGIFPDWELQRKAANRGGCLAARGRIYINPYGDVYPCNFWTNKSYGNIINDNIRDIIAEMQKDIPQQPDTCCASNVTIKDLNNIVASL